MLEAAVASTRRSDQMPVAKSRIWSGMRPELSINQRTRAPFVDGHGDVGAAMRMGSHSVLAYLVRHHSGNHHYRHRHKEQVADERDDLVPRVHLIPPVRSPHELRKQRACVGPTAITNACSL